MWGLGVNVSNSENEQVSTVYNEAQKYTDQSVKDTMIQNYITNITTRSEDVTELVKNFENNVSAEADSIQRNTAKFAACLDIDGAPIKQSNELVQDVKQGFEKLNEDVKILKKVLESESDTSITSDQAATDVQGASAATEQTAEQEQDSTQVTEQKAGFTALNEYNKILMRERFGITKSYRRKNKNISIREHFASYMKPERFCLFACADVNVSNSKSTQISNSTNIDLQTNIQTQDIYKKIDTAYDKTVETINKISEVINDTTNSIAKASSVQINEFIVETQEQACMLNLKNLSVEQKNKLEQHVELSTAIKSMNTLTTDTEVKAIMSDMMGLTQASETVQDTKTETKQATEQSQANLQQTNQTSGDGAMGGIVFIIIAILVVGAVVFMMLKSKGANGFYTYFDGYPEKKVVDNLNSSINKLSNEISNEISSVSNNISNSVSQISNSVSSELSGAMIF